MERVRPLEFLELLDRSATNFKRGMPQASYFQDLAGARVFSAVLRQGMVTGSDFTRRDDQDALHQCFVRGWLHSDRTRVGNLGEDVGYVFPSPLHRWFVEWALFSSFQDHRAAPFEPHNILKFVLDVVSKFSPRILLTKRRIGPSYIQRPPESQYQDEFYRCCHICSNGSLVTFPEFGTVVGRADFYIPAKKWGVELELLLDDDRLARHSGRFSDSGSYQTALPLSDHIILDFRQTRPTHSSKCIC